MSEATQVVVDSLNAQIAAVGVEIDTALVAGNSTATLRKRQASLQSDLAAAQARHDADVAGAKAAARQAAQDDAAATAVQANHEVNRALASIGAEIRLADGDERFVAVAQGITFAKLAIDEIESQFDAAHAKFEKVHQQLAKVTAKHDDLAAARRAGDESDKTAAALYAASIDLAALQALANATPMRGHATTERQLLASLENDFTKQKNDSILELARQDIANVENTFIERVRRLNKYARSERLINGGSVFSVIKPGERISYMLRTGSIPA